MGIYEHGMYRQFTAAEAASYSAYQDAMRTAQFIDDASDVCTCGQYDRDGEIGCEVPHDSLAADLATAIECYVGLEIKATGKARSVVLSAFRDQLRVSYPHTPWDEILPPAMVDELFAHSLKQMEVHGLPQRSRAA